MDDPVSVQAARAALDYIASIDVPIVDTLSLVEKATRDDPSLRDEYKRKLDPDTALARKKRMLNDLGADCVYYQSSMSKIIKITTIYMYNNQYGEAQSVLASLNNTTNACQIAEYACQVGILQGTYQLTLSQEKKVDVFISTAMSNEVYFKRLTTEEITSFWRVKFYVLYANFLKKNFEEVVKQGFAIASSDPILTVNGTEIKALDVLNNSDFDKAIHKDEILIAMLVSVLVASTPKQLADIHAQPELTSILGSLLQSFRPFASALVNARFAEFFQLLDGLETLCTSNMFFARIWEDIKLAFRKKAYLLYLSLVKRVSLRHLSNKLLIPEVELKREINDLIRKERLQFAFTEDETILEVVQPDKKTIYYERLNRLAEELDDIESALRTASQAESKIQSHASSPEPEQPKAYDPDSLDARLARYGKTNV